MCKVGALYSIYTQNYKDTMYMLGLVPSAFLQPIKKPSSLSSKTG